VLGANFDTSFFNRSSKPGKMSNHQINIYFRTNLAWYLFYHSLLNCMLPRGFQLYPYPRVMVGKEVLGIWIFHWQFLFFDRQVMLNFFLMLTMKQLSPFLIESLMLHNIIFLLSLWRFLFQSVLQMSNHVQIDIH
jgi:hypothetical protein